MGYRFLLTNMKDNFENPIISDSASLINRALTLEAIFLYLVELWFNFSIESGNSQMDSLI